MNDNGYCKYVRRFFFILENVQWWVIFVDEIDVILNIFLYFIFCNKKWLEKLLYVERLILKCVKGLDMDLILKEECLFMVRWVCNIKNVYIYIFS